MNSSEDERKRIIKIWILIIGSALNSLGIFISVPLINLYALDQFKLSAVEIGIISGIWPITVFTVSFLCGIIAERKGYINTLRLGLILNSIAFLVMTLSANLIQFCFSLLLFGLGKAFTDNSVRAAMIFIAKEDEVERFFRIRYLLQNVGCVIGPIVGVEAYNKIFGKTFSISTIVFMSFLVITILCLNNQHFTNKGKSKSGSIIKNFSVLKDLNLQFWIISGTCILMVYGAYEALMPVVISQANGSRPDYGFLVSLNAVVVIVIQLGHIKLLKNADLTKSIKYGFIILALGFVALSIDWNPFIMTLLGVIIMSIGESILFPCFDVIMGSIAPPKQKAVYYGAGELKQIGFFLGPVVGGVVLEYGNRTLLFIALSVTILIGYVIFAKINKNDKLEI